MGKLAGVTNTEVIAFNGLMRWFEAEDGQTIFESCSVGCQIICAKPSASHPEEVAEIGSPLRFSTICQDCTFVLNGLFDFVICSSRSCFADVQFMGNLRMKCKPHKRSLG